MHRAAEVFQQTILQAQREQEARLAAETKAKEQAEQLQIPQPAIGPPLFEARREICLDLFGDKSRYQHIKGASLDADVRCLCLVNDQLWMGSRDGTIHLRDVLTGKKKGEIKYKRTHAQSDQNKFFVNAIFHDRVHNRAWVGTSDGYLYVYEVYPGNFKPVLLKAINEHKGGVKYIVGTDTSIWSASEDFTIIQHMAESCDAVKKLLGHTSWVNTMIVENVTGNLWSGSSDGIRIWDPTPFPDHDSKNAAPEPPQRDFLEVRGGGARRGSTVVLPGAPQEMKLAQIREEALHQDADDDSMSVSSAGSRSSKKGRRRNPARQRSGSAAKRRSALERSATDRGFVLTSSSATRTKPSPLKRAHSVDNLHTGMDSDHPCADCISLLKGGHDGAVTSLCAVENTVWSGGADGNIVIWRVEEKEVVKKWKAHSGHIHTLCVVDGTVWTISFDKTIKIFNFQGDEVNRIKLDGAGLLAGANSVGAGRNSSRKRGTKTLRAVNITYFRGRLWMGCRSPGSIQLFRVWDKAMLSRVRKAVPRPATPLPLDTGGLGQMPVLSGQGGSTLQELVDMWNKEHRKDPRAILHNAEPPTDREGNYLLGGKTKMRLLAAHEMIYVVVGPGFVTMKEALVVNLVSERAIRFRQLLALSTTPALRGDIDQDAIRAIHKGDAPLSAPVAGQKQGQGFPFPVTFAGDAFGAPKPKTSSHNNPERVLRTLLRSLPRNELLKVFRSAEASDPDFAGDLKQAMTGLHIFDAEQLAPVEDNMVV